MAHNFWCYFAHTKLRIQAQVIWLRNKLYYCHWNSEMFGAFRKTLGFCG